MFSFTRMCLVLTLICGWSHAISAASNVVVVNGASYETPVAPGSIASLFGANLTTQTLGATTLPLPTLLAEVTVKINGKPAPLFDASSTQLNLQIPGATTTGTATVEVFSSSDATTPIGTGTVTIVESAPALFTFSADGKGQTAALNTDYSMNADFDLFPGSRPKAAGNYAIIYATGIGNTNPLVADGQPAPSASLALGIGTTSVTVGGVAAQVTYSGLAPGYVGLWQINVLLPENLPTNLVTSLLVNKGRTSQTTTLAIASKTAFSTLNGKVTDGLSGAALSKAAVSLAQTGKPARAAITNAKGEFSFSVLKSNSYNLQASAAGFLDETQSLTITDAQPAMALVTLAKQKPNIIVIVADDLGYADLGIQGSADIVTPNIDSIAKNGIRFTNGYVTAPVCAPSRAGLLTGRYQQRFGLELLPTASDNTSGLSVNETTLANRMKAFGYATSAIGKWHLGTQSQFLPQQRGFDEFFGFLIGTHSYTTWNQPNNPIYRGTQSVTESTYLTDAFSREAVDFIQRNQRQPFYLHLAYNAPHDPLEATAQYLARFPNIANTNRRTIAAMMAAMDDGVGKVLAKLRELKLEENTLVIFLSDNGGLPNVNASLNTPLNGQKDQLLEGGIRIPFMLQWKGYLPAGRVNDAPITSLDILPTAVSAAQGRKFSDNTLDGVNLIPFLAGVETALPHDKLYWRSGTTQYALRAGDWKLLFFQNTTRLYNLTTDPAETTNVAASNPTKLNELKAIYEQWNAQLPPAP